MSKYTALDKFGEKLIESVRNDTLDYLVALQEGRMKAKDDVRISERLSKLSIDESDLLNEVATRLVDNALHNILFMFESEEEIKVIASDDDGKEYNVNDVSDGLSGELYSDEGWIVRFGSHKSYL